ncbi:MULTISPECIES: hypothetical protein [Pseudomonas]|uniref:hypothetical protein n=1 Tax=Pseudomonas TaxID=286 RepID=UPI00123EE320|nr:hypothetical protein [Pseudomonas fluorescens]
MTSLAVDQNLRDREKLRRKALWTLSHLRPGDPKAIPIVSVLDEIALDELDTSLRDVAKLEELCDLIVSESRSRFLQASIGSTRLEKGSYLHDFQKFIVLWIQENKHLEAHRSAAAMKFESTTPPDDQLAK